VPNYLSQYIITRQTMYE